MLIVVIDSIDWNVIGGKCSRNNRPTVTYLERS